MMTEMNPGDQLPAPHNVMSLTLDGSIITVYLQSKLPIVTTGDTLGPHILAELRTKGLLNSDIGIFKVPHHGSRFNSQELTTTYKPKEGEKLHYFVMVLSAGFFSPMTDDELSAFGFTSKHVRFIQGVFEFATTKYFAAWSAGHPGLDRSDFDATLSVLSGKFRDFLKDKKFKYTGLDKSLALTEDDQFADFLSLLLDRYDGIVHAMLVDDLNELDKYQNDNLIGAGVLSPPLNLDNFQQYPYVPLVTGVGSISQVVQPQYRTLIDLLEDDPANDFVVAKLNFEFYKKFRSVPSIDYFVYHVHQF